MARNDQSPCRGSTRSVDCAARMLTYVQRTTVLIDDDTAAWLRHEAQRRSTTVSTLTREALEEKRERDSGRPRRSLRSAGAGDSGTSTISSRFDEHLRKAYERSQPAS